MLKASLCVALLCLASYSYASELVPLLAWSNSNAFSDVLPQSDMLEMLPDVKISDLKVAVLIKAPSLSFDDIAKYGGVYGEKNAPLSSVQKYLSTSHTTLSAAVSGHPARDILAMLDFEMSTTPQYIADVTQLPKFDGSSQQLIVVELPEGRDEETFRQHDDMISKVVDALSLSHLPYAIFYTTDHTSNPAHIPRHHANPNLVRRSAGLAVAEMSNDQGEKTICYTLSDETMTNCTIGKNTSTPCPCMLYCMGVDITLTISDANSTHKGNNRTVFSTNSSDAFTITGGSCLETTSRLGIYPEGVNYSYISMEVEFEEFNENKTTVLDTLNKTIVFGFVLGNCSSHGGNSSNSSSGSYGDDTEGNFTLPLCGFWSMNVFIGDDMDSLEEHKQFHSVRERVFSKMAVPLTSKTNNKISYACGNSSSNRFTHVLIGDHNDTYAYQFTRLQVQPFATFRPTEPNPGNFTYYFGSAYNCQGYLGAGSYMGVVAVLVLLLILYISSVFIFSIQTIDRFDDPRGDTIKVENLH